MHKDERNYVHQSFVVSHKPGKCAVSTWSLRGSRNFRQGGPGQSDKKALTTFFCFFFVFLPSAYFTEVKWLISKKPIIFQGFRGGPTFSRGVQLFHIETHITCDFPGEVSGPPVPPLDPHLWS